MIDRRNEYINWLSAMISNRQSYHNHKETMAWVITALYVPGVMYLGYNEGQNPRGSVLEWVVFAGILLLGFLVWIFIHMQFNMRWEAADTTTVLMQRWAKLYRDGEIPNTDEWKADYPEKPWPCFVLRERSNLPAKRNCCNALEALIRLFVPCCWDKIDNRWKTELPSYTAIILATLAASFIAKFN